MSELAERLWPDESEQPTYRLEVDGQSFEFTWENTRIQLYETGIEEFDSTLQELNHVIHKAVDENGQPMHCWFTFDVLGEDCVTYLVENGYPKNIDPKLDAYILDHLAKQEAQDIPEQIGPDFGKDQP
jgi:hypothetical protein